MSATYGSDDGVTPPNGVAPSNQPTLSPVSAPFEAEDSHLRVQSSGTAHARDDALAGAEHFDELASDATGGPAVRRPGGEGDSRISACEGVASPASGPDGALSSTAFALPVSRIADREQRLRELAEANVAVGSESLARRCPPEDRGDGGSGWSLRATGRWGSSTAPGHTWSASSRRGSTRRREPGSATCPVTTAFSASCSGRRARCALPT